jgi:hypothetical protein
MELMNSHSSHRLSKQSVRKIRQIGIDSSRPLLLFIVKQSHDFTVPDVSQKFRPDFRCHSISWTQRNPMTIL